MQNIFSSQTVAPTASVFISSVYVSFLNYFYKKEEWREKELLLCMYYYHINVYMH